MFIWCGGLLLTVVALMLLRPSSIEAKATWLWNASTIEESTQEIVTFNKKQGVKTIFLQIGSKVSAQSYRDFIRQATASGIEVHALSGQPDWALRESRHKADAFLAWVVQYNLESAPEERFTGIQFDVEPYLLKNWDASRSAIIEQWMEGIRVWVESAKRSNLVVGAAVPFWLEQIEYPGVGVKVPFIEWIVDKFDYLAIMAYRDAANRVYELSLPTLEEADRQKKKVWIGIELGASKEGAGVSFHEKPVSTLNLEVYKLMNLGEKHSSFSGVAIHSYDTWRNKLMQGNIQ